MSLPGVESARRRRASHGRSAALEPHVRLAKPVAASGQVLVNEGESSHSRAMVARHRLDEKLRAMAPCRSSSNGRNVSLARTQEAGHAGGSCATESGKRSERSREFELKEERMGVQEGKGDEGGAVQEECPVCLESMVAGQMVMCLPCHHRFHSTCLVPWLLSHCHCPFCRAHIAHPHGF